jgi:hypothetical protein
MGILRYYHRICLEGQRNPQNTLEYFISGRRFQPEYAAGELTSPQQRLSSILLSVLLLVHTSLTAAGT